MLPILNNFSQKHFSTINNTTGLLFICLFIFLGSTKLFSQDGKTLFDKYCAVCHSTTTKDMVGPGLAGVKDRHDNEWLTNWIHDPMKMVNSGDTKAVELFKKYNQVPMPGFDYLPQNEISSIITYITDLQDTANSPVVAQSAGTQTAKTGQYIYLFWTLVGVIILLIVLGIYKKRLLERQGADGFNLSAHPKPKLNFQLFLYILITGISIWLIVAALKEKSSLLNTMFFIVVPYASLVIFLIGSIYRYRNRGFQVSSLSSQFLEGRKLFWGSQPFHWGLLILFLGHLTAFLFPSAIIAWNGQPVRLMILEITGFSFGLAALFGLILLIRRRLTARKLLVVSNEMDMLVYLVLFVQIVSGLGVAFFVRWGSSWFASVMSPYLKSIFSLDPDILAVSDAPWLIQLHIISAFVIIGIIPFTRFMHFLVAPIDYIWRRYQLVIWNWNPKMIRKSTQHTYGKKSRNH